MKVVYITQLMKRKMLNKSFSKSYESFVAWSMSSYHFTDSGARHCEKSSSIYIFHYYPTPHATRHYICYAFYI